MISWPRRWLQTAGASVVLALAFAAPAAACPADFGVAPADIKSHFCSAWDAAPSGTLGSPLNDTHRWGSGWIRDFSGGSWGRGGILEGDGIGFAYVIAADWWNAFVSQGRTEGPTLGYPYGDRAFGGHIHAGPKANHYMTLLNGYINQWAGGTFETHGAILTKWQALGDVGGPVGLPLSNEGETARLPGRYEQFEGGNIIFNPRINGTYHIYGGILNKYKELGYSQHALGLPTSDRQQNPVKGNEYQLFDTGAINQYGGHAYETHGAIFDRWVALGGANGPVGLPTGDEGETVRVHGRYELFEGGDLIFNPRINAVLHVYGGLLNKYRELGYSNHPLGLPTSDRRHNDALGNDYQLFDGGVLNQYGGHAYETHGAILTRWNRAGGPSGSLGLPASDEADTARSPTGAIGRYERFQGGVINYVPSLNQALILSGGILGKYGALGYAASYLGLPTSDPFGWNGGQRQNFERGYIAELPGRGVLTNRELEGTPDDTAENSLVDDPPEDSPGGGDPGTVTFSDERPRDNQRIEQQGDALWLISAASWVRFFSSHGGVKTDGLAPLEKLLARTNVHPIPHSVTACGTRSPIDRSRVRIVVNGQDVTQYAAVIPASRTSGGGSCVKVRFFKYWMSHTVTVHVTAKTVSGVSGARSWRFSVHTRYFKKTVKGVIIWGGSEVILKKFSWVPDLIEAIFQADTAY